MLKQICIHFWIYEVEILNLLYNRHLVIRLFLLLYSLRILTIFSFLFFDSEVEPKIVIFLAAKARSHHFEHHIVTWQVDSVR